MRVQGKDLIPMDSQALFGFPLHTGGLWRLLNKRMYAWKCVWVSIQKLKPMKKSCQRLLVQKSRLATWEHTFQLFAASRSRRSQVTKCCWILRLYWLNQMFNRRMQACTRVHTPRAGSQLDVHVVLPGERRSQSFCSPDVSWALREPSSS